MWPQKWNAPASSGPNAAATAPPPAAASSIRPMRARNPRRDVECASAAPRRAPGSGTQRVPLPALGGREHALELREVIERSLREHGAVQPERDRERAAGNVQRVPGVGVALLVEDAQGHARIASDNGERRLERAAETATVRREDRQ